MNGAHASHDIKILKERTSKLETQIEAMMAVIKLQGKKITALKSKPRVKIIQHGSQPN